MPSVSSAQAGLIKGDYGRAKAGKRTRTGMSLQQLREWVEADSIKKAMKGQKRHG